MNTVVFLLLLALWTLISLRSDDLSARVGPLLEHRRAPIAFGAISALVVGWVWGGLSQVPVIHDEAAYLLQARIFAAGRWTMPGPPIPEFFEQFHVLVTPALASKYPPGHSLAMAPGALLGLPGLVPVLLAGVAGALLFALARRAAGAWVALLSWLLWMASTDNLWWRASYFSENTSSAAWMAAWWALARWQDTEKPGWLLAVAAFTGWGAITRPLTMLAFAVPLGVAVLLIAWRRKAWKPLAAAFAVGVAVLCVIPLWSAATTGSAGVTPLARYTRDYIPWDAPGFGLDRTPPARAVPSDIAQVSADLFQPLHAAHTPARLPTIAAERVRAVALGAWGWWTVDVLAGPGLWVWVGAALALVGALARMAEARIAAATTVVVFAAYLLYAHPAEWTVYYVELLPGLAFLSALGAWRVLGWIAARREMAGDAAMDSAASSEAVSDGTVSDRTAAWRTAPAVAVRGALALAGFWTVLAGMSASFQRERIEAASEFQRSFSGFLTTIPEPHALVFIRFAPNHNGHMTFVLNEPDPRRAKVVRVHDRGADNARLAALFPRHRPYLFDEETRTLRPLR